MCVLLMDKIWLIEAMIMVVIVLTKSCFDLFICVSLPAWGLMKLFGRDCWNNLHHGHFTWILFHMNLVVIIKWRICCRSYL